MTEQSVIMNSLNKGTETINNGIASVSNSAKTITNSLENFKSSVGNTLTEFSAKGTLNASREFLDSNSIIAKFVFLILILIAFMFLVSLGTSLIGYFAQPNRNPYLISGMISGSTPITIPQDPKNSGAITIYRSNNRNNGIEFTWSVWLFINNIGSTVSSNSTLTTYQHIFNKGDNTFDPVSGVSSVNNAPGLYLNTDSNTLRVYMDNVVNNDNVSNNQYLDITNVPINKWVNVMIRLKNNLMDVYVNGTVSGIKQFTNVPKQNYNNINICQNTGFSGYLSDLRYFDHDLSVFEINNIVLAGPNTNASSSASNPINATGFPYYLSNMWYTSKQ
jgi:hypothetical protein